MSTHDMNKHSRYLVLNLRHTKASLADPQSAVNFSTLFSSARRLLALPPDAGEQQRLDYDRSMNARLKRQHRCVGSSLKSAVCIISAMLRNAVRARLWGQGWEQSKFMWTPLDAASRLTRGRLRDSFAP